MTTMLERAARAVGEVIGYRGDDIITKDSLAMDIARAILMAVREPDDAVCDAGNNADYGCTEGIGLNRLLLGPDFGPWQHGLRSVFAAMIDSILNEDTTND